MTEAEIFAFSKDMQTSFSSSHFLKMQHFSIHNFVKDLIVALQQCPSLAATFITAVSVLFLVKLQCKRVFTKLVTFQNVRELSIQLRKTKRMFNWYCRESGTIGTHRF